MHQTFPPTTWLTRRDTTGPVTDYGATTTHWMRHRQPKYKGSYRGDLERPSPSYLINVRVLGPRLSESSVKL